MLTSELEIPGVSLGLLRSPDHEVGLRGGVIALHGASNPEPSQPLFDHLAQTLTPLGYAVLSYRRRHPVNDSDVPLADQSADARAALAALHSHLGLPVGLFGFSQGAWAACVAAAEDAETPDTPLVSFLALLGCAGVSPAQQMRFYTDELLRRSGYDAEVRRRARALRIDLEDHFRGEVEEDGLTADALRAASAESWFDLTYLPPELPPADQTWDDMDFDPVPFIARVTSRTLLVYGADEECVPAPESEAVWRSHGERDLTVVHLPRCGHFPVRDGAGGPEPRDTASISPDYTDALVAWFGRVDPTT